MNVQKCVRALLCLYLSTLLSTTIGQVPQALKIGDPLPPELWSMPLTVVNHPEGKETITLNEYKNKLIILDFWATWCGPCIKSLNKLDSLQGQFGNELAVVPLTYESAEKAIPLIKKRNWLLPSVVTDSLLRLYFPHKSIPHQVWIKEGKVLSIPAYSNSVITNIKKLLNNETISNIEKNREVDFDPTLPLLTEGNGGNAGSLVFHSKVSRFIDAEIAGERFRPNSFLMYNYSVQHLFLAVTSGIIPWHGRYNRLVSRLDSVLAYKVFMMEAPPDDDLEKLSAFHNWRKENLYSYQLIVPDRLSRKEMHSMALRDLNFVFGAHLGIHVGIESLPTRCLVIVRSSKMPVKTPEEGTPSVYENDGKNTWFNFTNRSFSHFFGVFAEQNKYSPMPIIDETGYSGNISLIFNGPLNDLEMAKRELNENGFELVEKEITLPMLVYSKLQASPAGPAPK